jgi:HK97 family phage major capsid protein
MSNRLNGLREKQGQTHDTMEALLKKASDEKRDLTPDEQQAFDELEKEFKERIKDIAREESVIAIKAALAKPIDIPGNDKPAKVAPTPRVRYARLKAFKGDDAEDNAYRSGMFIRATLMGDEGARAWCKEHGVAIVKAQSEGVNTAGGFLVPTQFEQAVIDLREEYGVFRMQCKVVPMGSDSMTIPRRSGGIQAYFVGENQQITESQKSWDQVQLVAKKIGALARMSTELAEDAVINIADDLAQEMAYAFAVLEDACGWNGDGTATYGGIVGARTKIVDGTHTASAIDAISGHDTFAEIDAVDLSNVMGALPKYAERGAKWYTSQPGWAVVFQRLIQAAGGTTMSELTGGKPKRSYLGYEVVIDQTLPTILTAQNNVAMLFFGDLSLAARLGERRGITVKTSGERWFEYDQMGIQATERVDINVHDLGTNSVAGPLIALVGNT